MQAPSIFIIDDDEINNVILSTYLSRYRITDNYEIFQSAVLALDKIRAEGSVAIPDLIILDVKMPDMDGFEFLEELVPLCTKFEKMPSVYMLSSSVRMRDKEQSFKYECVIDYIEKPMTLQQLKEIINKQLIHKSA